MAAIPVVPETGSRSVDVTRRGLSTETFPIVSPVIQMPELLMSLSTSDVDLSDTMREIFATGRTSTHAESDDQWCDLLRIDIDPAGPEHEAGSWRIMSGDRLIARADSRDLLVNHLENVITHKLVRALTLKRLFHAGAVARNGHGIIIPGESGAGKSTTTALLAYSGFEYLSDDIAVVDQQGFLRPFPKAMALKPGGWNILTGHRPEALGAVIHGGAGSGVVYVGAPAMSGAKSSHGRGTKVDFIVLPRKGTAEAGQPVLRRVPKAEAIACLTTESLDLGLTGRQGFDAIVQIVTAAECYELNVNDLDAAVAEVVALTE